MGAFAVHAFVAGVVMLASYIIYKWLLSAENQPAFNRAVLLAIYVLAFVSWPLLGVASGAGSSVAQGDITIGLPAATILDAPHDAGLSFTGVLLWIYAAGMIVTAGWTVSVAVRLARLVASGEKIHGADYILVLIDEEGIAPFSWGRYVVMSRNEDDEATAMILCHERAHIHCLHFADLLLAQVVCIVLWYNPASWLMLSELKSVHEYQADSQVLSSGINARQYQLLLIKKAVGVRFPSLANSLNHSKLKKRITMMYSKKSSLRRRMRALALVPAAAVAVAVANIPAVASVIGDAAEASLTAGKVTENPATGQELEPVVVVAHAERPADDSRVEGIEEYYVNGKKVPVEVAMAIDPSLIANVTVDKQHGKIIITLIRDGEAAKGGAATGRETDIKIVGADSKKKAVEDKADKADDEPRSAVEVIPQFKGGEAEMMKFLAMNIRYPEAAMKSGKQGYVVVKFVVSKSGKVESPEIVRSVSPELDAEALRVVGMMPDFTPGTVDGKPVDCTYTLPVSFKLQGDSAQTPAAN